MKSRLFITPAPAILCLPTIYRHRATITRRPTTPQNISFSHTTKMEAGHKTHSLRPRIKHQQHPIRSPRKHISSRNIKPRNRNRRPTQSSLPNQKRKIKATREHTVWYSAVGPKKTLPPPPLGPSPSPSHDPKAYHKAQHALYTPSACL